MRTLADVAPQELDDYKGTWVNVPHKPHPVIYMGEFESTGEIKHGARIFDPRYGDTVSRMLGFLAKNREESLNVVSLTGGVSFFK